MRMIVLALAALVGAAAPARANVILQIVDAPTGYTPNTPFTVELRAPGLTAFTAFDLDLIVSTPDSGTLTLTSVEVLRPAAGSYPFGATGAFDASPESPGSNNAIFSITGASAGAGVDTTAGVNDLLATIRVTPGANTVGPIRFEIDADNFTITALDENNQGFPRPDPLDVLPDTNTDPDPNTPVPVPAGAVLLALGGGLFVAARGRFVRGK